MGRFHTTKDTMISYLSYMFSMTRIVRVILSLKLNLNGLRSLI